MKQKKRTELYVVVFAVVFAVVFGIGHYVTKVESQCLTEKMDVKKNAVTELFIPASPDDDMMIALRKFSSAKFDVKQRWEAQSILTKIQIEKEAKEAAKKQDEMAVTETESEDVSVENASESVLVTSCSICENDGVDEYWVDCVNQQMNLLPDFLLQKFVNSGWHMYATSKNLDETYYGGQFGAVMGCTNYDEHVIYIEDRDNAVKEAPIHEFGHWLDCINGFVTNSNEFMDIYYAETDAFKSAFHVTFYYDNKELFAEGFWKYYTDANTLQSCCPRLYAFIKNVVENQ